MKGKSSNDDLAQSGTHLPRETHQLGRQARIYPGGWVQGLMFSVGAPHPESREHWRRPGSRWAACFGGGNMVDIWFPLLGAFLISCHRPRLSRMTSRRYKLAVKGP